MRNGRSLARQMEKQSNGRSLDKRSSEEVALIAADAAMDKKAEAPALLDLRGKSSVADYSLLLSGANDRHVAAITEEIVTRLKRSKVTLLGVEGTDTSQWVLIDLGDVLVHVFQEDARAFYDLDGLWPDAPRREIPGAPAPAPGVW